MNYDPYARDVPSASDTAHTMFQITPDDNADIAYGIKAIRIHNTDNLQGTAVFVTSLGDEVTLKVPGNTVLVERLRVARVKSTGTSVALEFHGYTDVKTS